jgi:uncharacterized protein (DUF2236 family)
MTAAFDNPPFDNPPFDNPPPGNPRYRPEAAGSARYFTGALALLGAPANVMMQMSLAPVGHGVVDSPVDSGRYSLRPVKRLRTTLTYLAVAMLGTPADRRAYREAVDGAHRLVRSGPDSAVRYNAFDPRLQLWVAACLYVGFRDSIDLMRGPQTEEFADALYRDCARLGTTLQVRPDMWPADRAAFDRYWRAMLPRLSVDEKVRAYLIDEVLGHGPLPRPVRWLVAPVGRFYTLGSLPPYFRTLLGLDARWSPRRQRVFEASLRLLGRLSAPLPTPVRVFPFNMYLCEMRLRLARGARLV